MYCSANKAGEGTAIESCTNVDVGNTAEFMLELSLDDCSEFGTEPQCVWEGEGEIGREEGNRREKERESENKLMEKTLRHDFRSTDI